MSPQCSADSPLDLVEGAQVREVLTSQDPREGSAVNLGAVGKGIGRTAGGDQVRPDVSGDPGGGRDVAGGVRDPGAVGPLAIGRNEGAGLTDGAAGHGPETARREAMPANAPEDCAVVPGAPAAHGRDGVPEAAGRVAHRVIAEALSADRLPDHGWLQARVDTFSSSLGNSLNARRMRINAYTSAAKYLSSLRPTAARLLCAEQSIAGTRPDLVWELQSGGIFFDELKTGRYVTVQRVADQACRQMESGWAEYGCSFIGVRVISIASPARSLLFSLGQPPAELRSTWLAIEALRGSHPVRAA